MADETLLNATAPRVPQTLRTHTARIVVQVSLLDQNGAVVLVDSLEVSLSDPLMPQAMKDQLVAGVKKIAQYLGRIP